MPQASAGQHHAPGRVTASCATSRTAAWRASGRPHDEVLDRDVAVKVLARTSARTSVRAPLQREARAGGRALVAPARGHDLRRRRARRARVHRDGVCAAARSPTGCVGPAASSHRDRRCAGCDEAARRSTARTTPASSTATSSPATCCSTTSERLAVADFGIARVADAEDQITADRPGARHRRVPRARAGARASRRPPRRDRYALAVVAFELLTGDRARSGRSTSPPRRARTSRIRRRRASSRNPDLPPRSTRCSSAALAKEPGDRYGRRPRSSDALERALAEPKTRADARSSLRRAGDGRRAAAAARRAPRHASARRLRVGTAADEPGRGRCGGARARRQRRRRDRRRSRQRRPLLAGASAALVATRRRRARRCWPRAAAGTAAADAAGAAQHTPAATSDGATRDGRTTADGDGDGRANDGLRRAATASPTATPAQTTSGAARPPAGAPAPARAASTPATPATTTTALAKSRAALAACGAAHQLDPCGYALFEEGAALNRGGNPAAAIPVLQQRLALYGDNDRGEVAKDAARRPATGRAEAGQGPEEGSPRPWRRRTAALGPRAPLDCPACA